MKRTHKTILAINPGTRYLGFAVFKDNRLIDWGISGITADSPDAKLHKTRSLVAHYLEEYAPSALVVKKLNPLLSTALLIRQQQEIRGVAQDHGLCVREYSIREMERSLLPEQSVNKRQLAQLVADKHPVLVHAWRKEQEALNPYHIRMFEAVALGMMAP